MNTVATIGKVISLNSIDGADRIVSAEVVCGRFGKWLGVVQKDQFAIGQLCEVYLQDCIVPQTERFAFMAQRKYIVRMARFKGVPSECLVMPLTITGDIGDDVTEQLSCTKYEKPIAASMAGDALGNFPSFIPKTDEVNFQTAPQIVLALVGKPYYITEKADGSSATVYKHDGHFGCCSRNLELKESPDTDNVSRNAIWQIAREYHLEENLPDETAIQFEGVGPKIQGNPMGLNKVEPRLFSVYSIADRSYLGFEALQNMSKLTGLPMVSLVEIGDNFPSLSDEELRVKAEGIYPNGKQREGIVIRAQQEQSVNGDRLSFKVINLRYKG